MYALLMILLLVALIYVYVKRSTAPQVMTPMLYGLVAVVLVLSIGRVFRSSRPVARMQTVTAIQEAFEQASAYMLGKAVAEDFPDGSTVLIVHGGRNQPAMQETVDAMGAAIREGMGQKQMNLHLDGPVFEGEDAEMLMEEIYLSGVELQRMLQQVSGVDVVISLIGPPHFRRPPPADALPPIYAMGGEDDGEEVIEIAMQRGIIRAAIAFRDDANVDWAAIPRRGMSREDVFNLRYRLRRADD